MATSRLQLYNDALLICGERSLSSLTENREPRYLLDQVWSNGGVNHCLEQGQWFFAMRTIRIDYDPAIEPEYGYQRAFLKPTDWINTSAICSDESFTVPLLRYVDEAGYWYSDYDEMYVRYVSNDSGYGNDLGRWPESFKDFVAAHFASKIAHKIGGKTLAIIAKEERKTSLTDALNSCAMALPTRFPARGSWSNARAGSRSRGHRSNDELP